MAEPPVAVTGLAALAAITGSVVTGAAAGVAVKPPEDVGAESDDAEDDDSDFDFEVFSFDFLA